MPTRLIIRDISTGVLYERFSVDGREMIARDPSRYEVVDDTTERAARSIQQVTVAGETVTANLAGEFRILPANRATANSA